VARGHYTVAANLPSLPFVGPLLRGARNIKINPGVSAPCVPVRVLRLFLYVRAREMGCKVERVNL
jgi:hypothetical protein